MDLIKKPKHYAEFEIEPADFIMLNDLPAWVANIVKYACRAGRKKYDGMDATASEIVDCKKIITYAEYRINQLEGRMPTGNKGNKNGRARNNGWRQRRLRNNKNND